LSPYKGRRRSSGRDPVTVPPIPPASSFAETAGEATARQRDIAMPRSMRTSRRLRIVRRIAIIATAVLVLALGATALAVWNYTSSVDRGLAAALVKLDPKVSAALAPPPKAPTEPFYMLILGVDLRSTEKVANSDTLILARVDPAKKHIALISIPRDTRVDIPGHGTRKINSAMMLGGPSLVIETVHDLTGLPISHFVQVNFWEFKDMVDAIGGVWVTVPQRIVDIRAANHDKSAYVVEKGYQKLDGKHALTFVRSRHYAMADYTRMSNQQTFIKALIKQTLQAGNIFKINAITDAMLKNLITDMKVEQILGLVGDFKDMDPKSVETVTMPSSPRYIDKVAYVILNDAGMRDMIERLAAGQPIDKSVEASSAAAASAAAASSEVDPKTVTVAVRNGAGGQGVASTNASRLSTAGFVIKETGNAARFVYPTTLIIYKDDQAAAEAVQSTLGYGTLVKSNGRYSFKTTVLVVVGKDWKTGLAAAQQGAPAQ
jgi:polyisoprenyl-teichoic acid--peptidoglycan teichoic acid transferase